MKLKCLTLFLFLFSFAHAQNTVLWKVTNEKNKNVSYLLGTNHLFGNSFVDSFPVIRECLKSCSAVITETKIEKEKGEEYYNSRISSDSLDMALSPEDLAYLHTVFKKSKVDMHKFTPGELYIKLQVLYPKYKCSCLKTKDSCAMDQYIQILAQQQGQQSYYLETDSFQLDKITEMTKKYDWAFFKKNAPAMLARYHNAAPDKMFCFPFEQYVGFRDNYFLTTKWTKTLPGIYGSSEMIKKRDDNWMQILPQLFETKNCFVAVGLAHLFFDCGLVASFRRMGYKVEPVQMDANNAVKEKE